MVKKEQKFIETYTHLDKKRTNNPPVGLVNTQTDPYNGKKTYSYDPHLDPQLIWANKAERTSFEIPTVSLHVHERINTSTIIENAQKKEEYHRFSLFEMPEENPPLREAIEFYKHKHDWSNRLIAGDSLLVMNSLLEKEALAGQIQMIYIDPPYGITYDSNFQPFIDRRNVKDGKDEDLTQEPEMIKAFRDTWKLGIHSYLTYLRDRLLLSRELLTESGSIFVQIGDKNVHLVKCLLDEVFGRENFVSLISFVTTSGFQANTLSRAGDYICWYAKDQSKVKYHQLFMFKEFGVEGSSGYNYLEMPDGTLRSLTKEEKDNPARIPEEARIFSKDNLQSQNPASEEQLFEFQGETYKPNTTSHWKANYPKGMERLAKSDRIIPAGNTLRYKRYFDDFPVYPINNFWSEQMSEQNKNYVVQTSRKVITRCLLMTTDPGDLVFDPTCGSGTTAYVAEKWGRRWITCDTSRVAITLAKQRLMTANYDYYELAYPEEGVSSGFKYKTIPHITLGSIANNIEIDKIYERWEERLSQISKEINKILGESFNEWDLLRNPKKDWPPKVENLLKRWWKYRDKRQKEINDIIASYSNAETLYDQPVINSGIMRVTGPFTVEAVPAPAVKSIDTIMESKESYETPVDESIARTGETSRQNQWRDELLKTGIRGKGDQRISFSRVEILPGTHYLHADAETKGEESVRAVISFGPEYAPLEQRQVEQAIEEAQSLVPHPKLVIFAAFEFDPEAAKDIEQTNWPGVTLLKVKMNADLLTEDLKKKRSNDDSYWLMGQPDVQLQEIKKGDNKGKWQVEIKGFDYFDTNNGKLISGGKNDIAMWLLDTDYDGRSLYPCQVFFTTGGSQGWSKLARTLQSVIDKEKIKKYRGTVSLPFKLGNRRRIAVKIVDKRGIESLKILQVNLNG